MDEIVLKWVTVLSGILTVIVCVSVFFFPDIHERAVLAAEQQKEVGGGNLIATTANPKAVVEQSKDLNAQLKIALPEGISKADVEIENDYVTQTPTPAAAGFTIVYKGRKRRRPAMNQYQYEVGDIVKLKKPHPCGSHEWEILRVGADFRLKCMGCGHQIMVPRKMVEKNTKNLQKKEK